MPLTANGMRVLLKQIHNLHRDPIDNIRLLTENSHNNNNNNNMNSDNNNNNSDLSQLKFEIDGPQGTPFESGRFTVLLCFNEEFPSAPPKGFFLTRIFHPNISEKKGDICVSALKKEANHNSNNNNNNEKEDYQKELGLKHILLAINCLLIQPNPSSALNEEAGRLLLENYEDYEKKARMITNIYAKRPEGVPRFSNNADVDTNNNNNQSHNNNVNNNNNNDNNNNENCYPGNQNGLSSLSHANNNNNNNNHHHNNSGGLRMNTEDTNNSAGHSTNAKAKAEKKGLDKKKAALKRI